jgi:hypothetical protein
MFFVKSFKGLPSGGDQLETGLPARYTIRKPLASGQSSEQRGHGAPGGRKSTAGGRMCWILGFLEAGVVDQFDEVPAIWFQDPADRLPRFLR